MLNRTKRVMYVYVSPEEYGSWDSKKTEQLLTVFEGGYCVDCGCVSNFYLKYECVSCFSSYYDNEYRVIDFICNDCGCEYNIKIGV